MRVYRALAGEPLGATIQRLRLSQAVHLLTQTSAPVSKIAGCVGFETPQAFARAFRQVLSISPSEARDRYRQHAKIAMPMPTGSAINMVNVTVKIAKPRNSHLRTKSAPDGVSSIK